MYLLDNDASLTAHPFSDYFFYLRIKDVSMSQQKPSAPRGMRDFGPDEMFRRNYIFSIIRQTYEKFGFLPLETPAMEKLETLTGKYGEEGDRLIFKVLNSGDFLKSPKDKGLDLNQTESSNVVKYICDRAMRYDLTVPFARYVVQYHHQLTFPFKRYQIQPVWRADNPQKGRYREFFQCDADVVGSSSLINEVELIQILNEVLSKLAIPGFVVYLNNRKILASIASVIGAPEKLTALTVCMDKLDKSSDEQVLDDLRRHGFDEQALAQLKQLIEITQSEESPLAFLEDFLQKDSLGMKGIEEVKYILDTLRMLGMPESSLRLDPTLARGLDYYTGCIIEVKVPGSGFGSIAGGGRYDDLTGIFGMGGLSGVGVSFGADRIYDLMLSMQLFPDFDDNRYKYFFLNFGEAESQKCLQLINRLRQQNIPSGIYPDQVKIKKQMEYADKMRVSYVCTIGSNELKDETIGVKNMQTGEQQLVSQTEFLNEVGIFS